VERHVYPVNSVCWSKTNWYHRHFIECNLFSPWYSCKNAKLALNNNRWLTQKKLYGNDGEKNNKHSNLWLSLGRYEELRVEPWYRFCREAFQLIIHTYLQNKTIWIIVCFCFVVIFCCLFGFLCVYAYHSFINM
jgi:hypothetical protein